MSSDSHPLALTNTAPRVPAALLQRRRLTDAVLPLGAITVIRAPGGAGKTVLLSQIVAQLPDVRGVWLSVDEYIDGRDAFWRALVPQLLGAERASWFIGAEDVIRLPRLIAAFRDLDVDCVVAVDDAHLLNDVAIAEDVLAVVRAVPRVSFIVASRAAIPPFESAAARISVDIRVLYADDLAFSLAEVEAFLGEDAITAPELLEASGGHALLLRALTLSDRRAPSGDGTTGDRTGVAAEYLAAYLAGLDATTRHFLLRTSLGGDFSLAEAVALVGPGDHAATIARLEFDGVLIRMRSVEVERYRYHPVVSDILQRDVAAHYPDDIEELRATVARQRLDAGDLPAALHHALLARDYGLASDVLVRGGTVLLRSGAAPALLRVPVTVALHHPLLATARGLIENARGRRWVAREFFGAALLGMRGGSSRPSPERASLLVAESMIARVNGNAARAVSAARRAVTMIERLGTEAFGEQRAELLSTCAVSFFRAGEWEDLTGVLEQLDPGRQRGGVMRAGLRAVVAAARGETVAVQEVERDVARAAWPELVLSEYGGAPLRMARTISALDRGHTAAARAELAALDRHRPTIEFRALMTALEAAADVLDGDAESALQRLRSVRAGERASRRLAPQDAEWLLLVEVFALAATGALGDAGRRLAAAADSATADLLNAHVALLGQDPDTAARALVTSRLVGHEAPRVMRARHLLLAWCADMKGDERGAREALARVSGIGVPDAAVMLLPMEARTRLAELACTEDAAPLRAALTTVLPAPFLQRGGRPRLTARELAVLRELRHGESNASIAASLMISRNTVKTQLRTGYQKLGVSTREEALARMSEFGLFDGEETPGAAVIDSGERDGREEVALPGG